MSKEKRYESLLVMAAGFLLIGQLFHLSWMPMSVFLLIAISMAIPPAGKGILWVWFKISEGMGWVMSRVLLSIVFYIILLPISKLSRALSKEDPLKLKKQDATYYDTRNHDFTAEGMENLW